jgi:hypothetical protein
MTQLRNFRQLLVYSKLGVVPDGVDLSVFQDWQLKTCLENKLDLKVAEGVIKKFLPFLRKKESGYKWLEDDVISERNKALEMLTFEFKELTSKLSLEKGLKAFRKFRYETSDMLINSFVKIGLKYNEVVELAKMFLNDIDVRYLRLLPKVLQDVVICVLASFSDDVVGVARSLLRRDAIIYFPDSLFINESG